MHGEVKSCERECEALRLQRTEANARDAVSRLELTRLATETEQFREEVANDRSRFGRLISRTTELHTSGADYQRDPQNVAVRLRPFQARVGRKAKEVE